MAFYDDTGYGDFMLSSPEYEPSVDMSGFYDPSFSWDELGGPTDYSSLYMDPDVNTYDLGAFSSGYSPSSFDPVNTFGQSYDLGLSNLTDYSDELYGIDPSLYDRISSGLGDAGSSIASGLGSLGSGLASLGSKAMDWLGQPTAGGRSSNLADLAGLGMGALGLYGNYRAQQEGRGDSRDRLALEKALRTRELDQRQQELNEKIAQQRLASGSDEMARQALGMQLLVNRGRMTEDQVNPWLNMMYTGRQAMFANDPVTGQAFQVNPFTGSPVGAAVSQPKSANEFFLGLDPVLGRPQQLAHGGAFHGDYRGGGGALGLLRGGSPGQADDVNANLSHGEYVWDADVVSALGDGNTEAGAARLDEMRERIRQHKRSAPASDIPPKAKDPMKYLGK